MQLILVEKTTERKETSHIVFTCNTLHIGARL